VKVTKEKTENSQAFLTIEMEPAEVEESLDKSYYRLVRKTNVPGFRKGKAPREVLERYLGKECLLDNAIDNLLPEAYAQAVKEQEIEAIARPHIEIAEKDPVVFKVTVPLKPTIKLGDYHHIQVMPEAVELNEGDVDATIEQLRHEQATWEPVERPVEFDDLVALDIESNIEDKPFINRKGVQYHVVRDLSFPTPGFAEQLVGMKRNEDKEFKLQFPSDFPNAELVGKEAWFKVGVTEIKQERLPELDGEFARGIDPDFTSLDSLREQVSANLKLRAEEKARIDYEERVIQAVVDLAELEFPPILVERETDRLLSQRLQRLQMGEQRLEEYLKSINKTKEELREELHPLATKGITRSLVLGEIAEEEKVEVTDSEIDAEIENITKGAAEKKDELQEFLNRLESRESIQHLLTTRKTIQQLVEIAKGSNTEVK